jgi:glycosyltransferase involved in cell wall biosynthesis
VSQSNSKVLVVATSIKSRGGITSVVKAHLRGEQWKKYHCRWIETHRDGSYIRKLWYLFVSLFKYIFLLPFYDCVHIHFSITASAKRKFIFFRIAKILDKKIIIHFHAGNQLEEMWNDIYNEMFSTADKSLVLSSGIKKIIEGKIGKSNKTEVLYNPCPQIIKSTEHKKQNIILFAGTLMQLKGYEDLLKAFASLKECKDWILVFAGNGEIAKAEKLSKELGIEKRVRFLGWVNGDEKDKIFREASIFCLPSYAEGFPMAVLDAWAYGIPVVTTPVGGIPDIVKDSVNGLLFQPGDIEKLSQQLEKLIQDKELRETIVAESDKLVNEVFNINVINKKLDRIYLDLLSK